jgi:hypothetical protein
MAAKGDQTAVLFHCASCRGTVQAACGNVGDSTRSFPQSIVRLSAAALRFYVPINARLDCMDISEVLVHCANAF